MRFKKILRRRIFQTIIIILALFCLNIARYAVWPPVGGLADENPRTTAFIEYREQEWREAGREKSVRQTWRSLKNISPALIKAVVVSEDSRFWDHAGFDLAAMKEALQRNLERKRFAAGGSTITQQLAKNLYFSPDKSFVRKAQEALVTLRLELALSKGRILELYLNCVEWGDGIFGAEAAARHYFGVSAAVLTPSQAATLAVLLPSPRTLQPGSPYVRKQTATIVARMRIE